MTERRHLVGLELAVCALGATVLASMVLIGVDVLRFHESSPVALVLAFEALVLALMVGSLTRQARRQRAFSARLPSEPRAVLDTDVHAIASRRAHAFTIGFLRPRIYISDGLIDVLDERELLCVLAHERHHAQRHDPLRRALVKAVCDGFWFIPALRRTARTHATVSELAADAVAMSRAGAQPLASALLAFEAHGGSDAGASTERVRFLLGEIGWPGHAVSLRRGRRDPAGARRRDRVPAAPRPDGAVPAALHGAGRPLALLVLAAACVPAGLLGRAADRLMREG